MITDVGVRVRVDPEQKVYEGWFAPGFAEGIEIIRALAQEDALPEVVRLSDRDETEVSLALSGLEGLKRSALEGYLRMRGRTEGCMVIAGWEGERESVERRRQLSRRILRRGGAVPLGRLAGAVLGARPVRGPAPARRADRRGDPRRDARDLAHLRPGRRALRRGARRAAGRDRAGRGGGGGLVMCHVSHAYRDGASLYFTFLTPAHPGAEIEQWRGLKGAACDAIVAQRGDDHPSSRRRDRPRPLHAGRDRRTGDRRTARRQVEARPGRDHESRASWSGLSRPTASGPTASAVPGPSAPTDRSG